jgi:hypothetical protein
MPAESIQFAAVVFCGLALVPAAAHVMELPNKIHLSREDYLVAQKLYRGWQFVGIVVVLALIATALLALQARGSDGAALAAAWLAFICVVATQAVFWIFTFPVNRITKNWTSLPADWMALRRRWEYSHAASAALNLLAFAASVLAALRL